MEVSKILAVALLVSVALNAYLFTELQASRAGGATEPGLSSSGAANVPPPKAEVGSTQIAEALSEARAVPYFRNGVSIGMRIFSIKEGGVFTKADLRNGDIIRKIDGVELKDPAEALRLVEPLLQARPMQLEIEREGQVMELKYPLAKNGG